MHQPCPQPTPDFSMLHALKNWEWPGDEDHCAQYHIITLWVIKIHCGLISQHKVHVIKPLVLGMHVH